ncbi:hypothetical protein ACIBL6_23015 [Streptomyces sp. NPDC050400]|uniref:hypothetical protein n=1 Tax=Streptomyces sp. NPDC050400 TaxID=3365610 RepID=UPI00379E7CBE
MKVVWALLAMLFGGLALAGIEHAVKAADTVRSVGDIVMTAFFAALAWTFVGHAKRAAAKSREDVTSN